jgi:hypothetical protein
VADDRNPEIRVKLSAEDTGVAAAIRQLGQELKNLKKNEQEASEGAISLSKAFEGIVAIGGLLKLEEIGKEAFNAAVDISKMSDKTGLSTETLSVFHKVAEDVGASTEGVDKALIKAAKSITEFEQGSSKAAKAFATLGIHQKDFANLKPDDKIKLVTERLGGLEKGFEKSTAQQLIFGKGTSDIIVVLNSLAAQGFEKATAATARLGLLLSKDAANSFIIAKASMAELTGAGRGMATQFEAGLLPAVADVAEAFTKSLARSGSGFKDIGKLAGQAVREIVFQFLWMGETIGRVFASVGDFAENAWEHIEDTAKTGAAAFKKAAELTGTSDAEAFAILDAGHKRAEARSKDEVERQKAIWKGLADSIKADAKDLGFGRTPAEQAAIDAERLAALGKGDKEGKNLPGKIPDEFGDKAREDLREQSESERIAKAQTEFLVRQLQSDLEEWKSYEKLREQEEKTAYEESQLTTAQYHERRRADIKAEAEQELNILRQQMEAADAEVTRSAELRTENLAKQASLKTQASDVGERSDEGKKLLAAAAEYGAAAAREQENGLAAASRQYEFLKKTKALQNETQTKLLADVAETNKETEEGHRKWLEFEAQLAALQGKRIEQSKAQIEAEAAEKKKALEANPEGRTPGQITAEVEQWKELALAASDFAKIEDQVEQKEKTFQIDRNSFDIARASIEAQQRAGLISKSTAEKKINDLIDARVPLLRQEAAAELAIAQAALRQAQATGNQNDIAKAQQQVAAAQNLGAEIDKLATKTQKLATDIKGALTQDFNTFFSSMITGSKSAGQAFAQLGVSIVQSLEEIVAQMLVTMAIEKVFNLLGLGDQAKANTTKQKEVIAANTAEAASDIFVQAIEFFPFPANLAAAPALAGVAEAEMGALTAGAGLIGGSAAQGAYLNKDMLLQAHAEEMVLPPHLSTGLDYAIRTGSFNPPEALSQPITSNHRGGDTYEGDIHLHHNGEDAKKVLERELVPMIKNARRQGKIRL